MAKCYIFKTKKRNKEYKINNKLILVLACTNQIKKAIIIKTTNVNQNISLQVMIFFKCNCKIEVETLERVTYYRNLKIRSL